MSHVDQISQLKIALVFNKVHDRFNSDELEIFPLFYHLTPLPRDNGERITLKRSADMRS